MSHASTTCIHDIETKYRRLSPKWKSNLPIHATETSTSWLSPKKINGVFGMGCTVCYLAKVGTMAAKIGWNKPCYAQFIVFQRHACSYKHQKALHDLFKIEMPPRHATIKAPSADAFRRVYEAIMTGKASSCWRYGIEGVGKYRKISRMSFCLAEAVRAKERIFLKKCKCIAIHPDTKGVRFAMRFSASNTQLQVQKNAHLPKPFN